MRYTWLLKCIVAPDRPNLELGDAVVLQHCPQLCLDLRGQLLYTKQQAWLLPQSIYAADFKDDGCCLSLVIAPGHMLTEGHSGDEHG